MLIFTLLPFQCMGIAKYLAWPKIIKFPIHHLTTPAHCKEPICKNTNPPHPQVFFAIHCKKKAPKPRKKTTQRKIPPVGGKTRGKVRKKLGNKRRVGESEKKIISTRREP
jgi:hypothetical protein